MKSLLIVTDVDFWIEGAGHRARIAKLVKILSSTVKLTVAYCRPSTKAVDNESYIEAMFDIKMVFLNKERLLTNSEYGEILRNRFHNIHLDFCIIEYIHNSFFLKYLNKSIIRILDLHDIYSDREISFKKFGHHDKIINMYPELEKTVLNLFDYVLPICEPDYERLKDFVPINKIITVSHSPTLVPTVIRKDVLVIGFIGSAYLPNKDGIQHFINGPWQIISKLFNVQLNIYGKVISLLSIDKTINEKINTKGFIPQLDQIYDEIDIAINPVRFGAGIKIKNIEALAHMKPLITTSHGARGLEKGIGNAFLIANNDNEFVDCINKLVTNYDLRQNIALAGFEYIKRNFGQKNCYGDLLDILIE